MSKHMFSILMQRRTPVIACVLTLIVSDTIEIALLDKPRLALYFCNVPDAQFFSDKYVLCKLEKQEHPNLIIREREATGFC